MWRDRNEQLTHPAHASPKGKQLAELNGRFGQLASNHKETVTFMEGHKADKERLSQRVSVLEGSLANAADTATATLTAQHQSELAAARATTEAAESKAIEAEKRATVLEQQLAERESERVAAVQRAIETEAQLKAAVAKSTATAQVDAAQKAELERLQARVAMGESAADRLKAELAVAQAQVKTVNSEVAAVTKERDSLKSEVAELNRKLTEGGDGELGKIKKEYHAYKRYSTQLLEKEKEVNARLRHLGNK